MNAIIGPLVGALRIKQDIVPLIDFVIVIIIYYVGGIFLKVIIPWCRGEAGHHSATISKYSDRGKTGTREIKTTSLFQVIIIELVYPCRGDSDLVPGT